MRSREPVCRPARGSWTSAPGGDGSSRTCASLGYQAEGIDPSPRGQAVTKATIEEHSTRDLDAVVMWHSLEHVPDPAAAMARAREMLRPGGVLVVGAPNIASLQASVGGRAWFHLDLPRHRTHFTPAGLRALMSRSGIQPARTYHLVPEHNFHGMWFALLSRLGMTPGFPFHLLKRNAAPRPRDLALLLLAGPLLLLPASRSSFSRRRFAGAERSWWSVRPRPRRARAARR